MRHANSSLEISLPPGEILLAAPIDAQQPWLELQCRQPVTIHGAADGTTRLVRVWDGQFNRQTLPPLLRVCGPQALTLVDLTIDAQPWYFSAGTVIDLNPVRIQIHDGHHQQPRMAACQIGLLDDGRLVAGKLDWAKDIDLVRQGDGTFMFVGDDLDVLPQLGQTMFGFLPLRVVGAFRSTAAPL